MDFMHISSIIKIKGKTYINKYPSDPKIIFQSWPSTFRILKSGKLRGKAFFFWWGGVCNRTYLQYEQRKPFIRITDFFFASIQVVNCNERHQNTSHPQFPILLLHFTYCLDNLPLTILQYLQKLTLLAVLDNNCMGPASDVKQVLNFCRNWELEYKCPDFWV